MQFIIGMYWEDVSPDTLSTSIRAFIGGSESSLDSRLMSVRYVSDVSRLADYNEDLQHSALDSPLEKATGSESVCIRSALATDRNLSHH